MVSHKQLSTCFCTERDRERGGGGGLNKGSCIVFVEGEGEREWERESNHWFQRKIYWVLLGAAMCYAIRRDSLANFVDPTRMSGVERRLE